MSGEQVLALGGTTALLHSARAARRLAALTGAHNIRRSVHIAALSAAVAAAAGPDWASISIAATPTDAALIDAARTRD